jgi:hypothetical protein
LGPVETVKLHETALSASLDQRRRPHPDWRKYETDATVFIAA